jgi:hypothetical protein
MIAPIAAPIQKPFLRPAPAYQEYASDVLADQRYRLMSLAERGLWDTLRKECWVNHKIPSNVSDLAKFLGLDERTLNSLLTERLLSFFQIVDGCLVCPELIAYRDVVEDRRKRQSIGGATGGRRTQTNSRSLKASLEAKVKPLSRDESIRSEPIRGELSMKDEIDSEWVANYDMRKAPYE